MINFEVLLPKLGSFGLAQIIACICLGLNLLLTGYAGLATVFIGYTPRSRCNVSPLDNKTAFPNLTEDEILNLTIPWNPSTGKYDTCNRYGFDLSSCDSTLSCVNKSAPVIPCDNGYYYDKSLFTETVVTEFDLVCDRSYLNALSTSLYYVGFLIASIVFGDLLDRLGRKPVRILTFIAALGSSFGVTYSVSFEMYAVFRTLLAAFIFGTYSASFAYAMEIVAPSWRKISGRIVGMSFPLGYMIFGGIAYNWRNWRQIEFYSTVLCLPCAILLLLVPESPRWLFAKGKDKEGKKVVKLMERINKRKLTDNDWAEAETKKSLTVEESGRKYSFLDLFKTPRIRIVTFKLATIWFINNFIYYGISLNAGALSGDIFLNNTLNGVFGLAGSILVVILIDYVGRRWLETFFLVFGGLTLIASTIVNEYAGDNQALITLATVFAFLAKLSSSGAFAALYYFTFELYPTVIRSTGFGFVSFAGRLGSIIAPFAIDLQRILPWLLSAIFGVCGILAGAVAFTIPDTKGQPMMETIEQAEKFYKNGNRTERTDSNHSSFNVKQFTSPDMKSYDNSSYLPEVQSGQLSRL